MNYKLPPHPPLWALRQRQPRREHRDRPRIPRCRPARRRSAAAARCRARGATRAAMPTRAALPMPALRRTHDRDRGVRTRLRAEVAADAGQVRHVMSQTSSARRRFPVPLRWLHAGGDLSRHKHANQRADRPLIRPTPSPRRPLHASRPALTLPSRSPGPSFAPTIMASAKIKSP